MWRNGIVLKSNSQLAEIVAESGQDKSIIRVQCQTDEDVEERFFIQRISEEISSLFKSAFSKMIESPSEQYIVCPHCLKQESEKPRMLLMKVCVEMVVSGKKDFECGDEIVNVSLLGNDVTFGHVKVFEEDDVKLEEKHFASGGFGNIFKGALNKEVIVAKEMKPEMEKDGFEEFQHEVSITSKVG